MATFILQTGLSVYSSDREEQEELISAFHILSVVKASSQLNYHIPYSTQLSLPVAATGPLWRVLLLLLYMQMSSILDSC